MTSDINYAINNHPKSTSIALYCEFDIATTENYYLERATQVYRVAHPADNTGMASISQFMQRQTAAAHPRSPTRPNVRPTQNVLQVTGTNSQESVRDTSDDGCSSPEPGMMSPPDFARCSRCQRTESLNPQTGQTNMIQYGLNLHYCNRCAAMVGYKNG